MQHYKIDGTPTLLEKIRDKKPTDFEPTLIHGDCTIDDVLVYEGRISGIIDWSGGVYGDPRYDVS
ncbi:phosphotransferase family protein [Paenibacillus xerothermodurans]|uniref:Aminoglycoside phosphotransferase family protein n=1 Tax=Paenibacillus xerothermodurans TaxID=1977292 RepID=A0A2W1NZL4_PAEXE|nr:aminoglycoside phosphotransferase family protein [Paenibacillus xerothermodurans]